jgi:VWFA-related protein
MKLGKFRKPVRRFLFAVCAIVVSLGAAAQNESSRPQTLKVTTNLVVLDVVVGDRKGDPIKGLGQQDFSIFEDSKQQPIKSFEAHEGFSVPRDSGNQTIAVLDELNADVTEISYSRTCLRKYLLAQPQGKLREPMTLLAASNDGLKVIHGYTADAIELLKVLEAYSSEYPYKASRGFGEERLAETMSFLQQIALSSRGEQKRKNVIWIGRAFPNVISANISVAEEQSVELVLRQTVNMLLSARVAVTKIDPTATTTLAAADPYGFSDQGPDPYADGVSFNAVVVQTGGRLYFARNDLDREIAQSVDQGRIFYTLAYTPQAVDGVTGAADLYRHIRVAVDRDAITVQTKHGYYPDAGLPVATSKGELSLDLWQAANTSLTYSGILLHFDSITHSRTPGSISCAVSVSESALSYEPDAAGDRHADVYLVISSFSEKGKLLSSFETKAVSTIKKEQASGDSGQPVQAVFRLEVPLAAQASRMRIVMRDARSGRTGTVDAGSDMLPK